MIGLAMANPIQMPKVTRAAIIELLEIEPIAKTMAIQTKVLRMFPIREMGSRCRLF